MPDILIADDHAVVRSGVRLLLEREPDFRVLAEVGTGAEAMRVADELRPDVVVLDLSLPDVHGLEVVRHLRSRLPAVRTVVLSMHSSEAYVLEALRSGAQGYVLKESAASDLVQAIRAAAAGRQYLSRPAGERPSAEPPAAGLQALSPRERQVLRLAAEGCTNTRMAELLGISARTVEAHRARVMQKLGLHGQADLIKYALRHQLIRLEDSSETA